MYVYVYVYFAEITFLELQKQVALCSNKINFATTKLPLVLAAASFVANVQSLRQIPVVKASRRLCCSCTRFVAANASQSCSFKVDFIICFLCKSCESQFVAAAAEVNLLPQSARSQL